MSIVKITFSPTGGTDKAAAALCEGLGGAENTARALEEFREKTVKAGFPGLELMATSQKYIDPKILPDTGKDILSFINEVFDSVTHYQFCHFLSVKIGYPAILQELEAKWDEVAKRFGGGGHVMAAGCTVVCEDGMEAVIEQVCRAILAAL